MSRSPVALYCGFCGHWEKGARSKEQIAEWLRLHRHAMLGPYSGSDDLASTCPHPCGTPLAEKPEKPELEWTDEGSWSDRQWLAVHTALMNAMKDALEHCYSSEEASGFPMTSEGWMSCSASNIIALLQRHGSLPDVGDITARPMPVGPSWDDWDEAEANRETVKQLINDGVLVRADCDECNNRGETYETPQGLDGWPNPCPVCDGGKHPLYRVITDNQETTDEA